MANIALSANALFKKLVFKIIVVVVVVVVIQF